MQTSDNNRMVDILCKCRQRGLARTNFYAMQLLVAGPTFDVTFSNGTQIRLEKNNYLTHVGGAYDSRIVEIGNSTKQLIDDIDHMESIAESRVAKRNLNPVNKASTNVLFFYYVMVSDWKRFEHYGDVAGVMADTLKEVAVVNAVYLLGDSFTPQVQFRVLEQIVFTSRPAEFTASNDESGPYVIGVPANKIDGDILFKDFWNWVFFNSEFARDGTKITRRMSDLGNQASGWHLLTGFWGGAMVGLANTVPCQFPLDIQHRTTCESLLSGVDSSSYWLSDGRFQGTPTCRPQTSVGWTSMVNTHSHRGAGIILAHELGHNLGFQHAEGDCAGNNDVMSPYVGEYGKAAWSQCSINTFTSNWANDEYSCAVASDQPKMTATALGNAYGQNYFSDVKVATGAYISKYGSEHDHNVPVIFSFVVTKSYSKKVVITGVRLKSGNQEVYMKKTDVTASNGFSLNFTNVAIDESFNAFLSKDTTG
jgi:hypothetical protein